MRRRGFLALLLAAVPGARALPRPAPGLSPRPGDASRAVLTVGGRAIYLDSAAVPGGDGTALAPGRSLSFALALLARPGPPPGTPGGPPPEVPGEGPPPEVPGAPGEPGSPGLPRDGPTPSYVEPPPGPLRLVPNPARAAVSVHGYAGPVVVVDLAGRTVLRGEQPFGGVVDVSRLRAGSYVVRAAGRTARLALVR
jgi:hypothetical protein